MDDLSKMTSKPSFCLLFGGEKCEEHNHIFYPDHLIDCVIHKLMVLYAEGLEPSLSSIIFLVERDSTLTV